MPRADRSAGSGRKGPGRARTRWAKSGYFPDSYPPLPPATQGSRETVASRPLGLASVRPSRSGGLEGKSWLGSHTGAHCQAGCGSHTPFCWLCQGHLPRNNTCPQEPLRTLSLRAKTKTTSSTAFRSPTSPVDFPKNQTHTHTHSCLCPCVHMYTYICVCVCVQV